MESQQSTKVGQTSTEQLYFLQLPLTWYFFYNDHDESNADGINFNIPARMFKMWGKFSMELDLGQLVL